MQNKIRALPGTRRAGNQTSLIGSNFSSAFLFALSFFFAIKSFYPLGVIFYWVLIPVLFQSRNIPHHASSLSDSIQAYGFHCHLGTANSPPRPCFFTLGLCILCCLPAPDFHLDIPQASQTWGFSTSANMLLLNSHVSIHGPTFTQCPKIEICLLRLFALP